MQDDVSRLLGALLFDLQQLKKAGNDAVLIDDVVERLDTICVAVYKQSLPLMQAQCTCIPQHYKGCAMYVPPRRLSQTFKD